MKRLLMILAAATLLAACGGSTTTSSSNVAATSHTPTIAQPATAHPAATADSNTDLLLPSSTDGQSYFVGAADITNTGNVGIVVLVTIRFAQVSNRDIADLKTVRIPFHASRTVKFKIPVTGSQVDQLQASPGYANKGIAGRIRTTIVDTFGTAQ